MAVLEKSRAIADRAIDFFKSVKVGEAMVEKAKTFGASHWRTSQWLADMAEADEFFIPALEEQWKTYSKSHATGCEQSREVDKDDASDMSKMMGFLEKFSHLLMKKQGIQTGEGGNELTVDARPSECNNDRVGPCCHSLTVDCCCANSDLLCVLGRRAHGQGAAEVRLRCAVPGPPDLLGIPGDAEAGGQERQRTDLLVGNAAAAGLCVQSNPAPACFDGPSSMALTVPAARRVVTQGPTELKGRSTSTTQV